MEPLQVFLFGGFDLRRGGEAVPPIPSRAGRSLFALLVMDRGVRHPRERLADRFWPDLPPARARRRLSHTLWQIQDALGELPGDVQYLEATPDALAFSAEAACWVDVEEFERRFDELRERRADGRTRARDLPDLEQVVELYRGEFLSGHYEAWVVDEQERLQQRYLEALTLLIAVAKGQGAYDDALLYARRLTNQDPLREDGHREVMRLSMLLGRTADAIRQFERCREVLAEELGTEPAAATVQLYERIIRQRDLGGVEPLPDPSPFPERLPLVGRERERSTSVAMLDRALAGRGGCVLVEADPGVGKTRLLAEVVDDAHWRGFTTLHASCRGPEGHGAYAVVRELLEGVLTPLKIERMRHRIDAVWLAQAARMLPVVQRALPPEAMRLATLRDAEGAERMREALVRVVSALAELDPLVLVVDDLQWCDEESLGVLEAVAANVAARPLLVVLGYRGDDARGRDVVWETIRAVDRRSGPERLLLGPLDAFSIAELARTVAAGHRVGASIATRLQRETGGNPLFVIETLRALVEDDRLAELEGDDAEQLPLPGSIRELVLARVDRLAPEAREVLDVVAVGGDGTDLDTLVAATELPRATVADAAELLLRRALVREVGSAFGMHHDQIRRVALSALTEGRSQAIHRRVGEALEALHPDQVDRLAHHFGAAGVTRKAVGYLQQAARAAAAVHAYATADTHYRRAIELQGAGPSSVAARFELLAEHEAVLDVLGERERQLALLDEMAALATGDRRRSVEVERRRALLIGQVGEVEVAVATAREALEGARALDDPALVGAAHTSLATVLTWAGRREDAVPLLTRAAELADEASAEAEVRTMLGSVLRELQRYDAATAELDRALAIAREHGELREEARALSILGTVHMETGDTTGAERLYRRAIDRCRAIGFRRGEAISLVNHATVLYFRGEVGQALVAYDGAEAIARDLGDRRTEWIVRMNRAFVRHAIVGDDTVASPELEGALAFFGSVGDVDFAALCRDALAGVALRAGDVQAARGHVEHGLGDRPGGWALAQLLQRQAEVALGAGDIGAASDALTAARDSADQHGLADRRPALLALAGRVHLACDRPEEALRATSEAVDLLHEGIERGYLVYHRHHQALAACGYQDAALAAADAAVADLERVLDRLPPEDRERAVEVPEHREVLAARQRLQPHRRTVLVASAEAPVGRPLGTDEQLEVTLDLAVHGDAPDDPIARRRWLLERAVDQILAAGGLATVGDLAAALEVSEATVRRDLQVLRAQGARLPTRGRRAG